MKSPFEVPHLIHDAGRACRFDLEGLRDSKVGGRGWVIMFEGKISGTG